MPGLNDLAKYFGNDSGGISPGPTLTFPGPRRRPFGPNGLLTDDAVGPFDGEPGPDHSGPVLLRGEPVTPRPTAPNAAILNQLNSAAPAGRTELLIRDTPAAPQLPPPTRAAPQGGDLQPMGPPAPRRHTMNLTNGPIQSQVLFDMDSETKGRAIGMRDRTGGIGDEAPWESPKPGEFDASFRRLLDQGKDRFYGPEKAPSVIEMLNDIPDPYARAQAAAEFDRVAAAKDHYAAERAASERRDRLDRDRLELADTAALGKVYDDELRALRADNDARTPNQKRSETEMNALARRAVEEKRRSLADARKIVQAISGGQAGQSGPPTADTPTRSTGPAPVAATDSDGQRQAALYDLLNEAMIPQGMSGAGSLSGHRFAQAVGRRGLIKDGQLDDSFAKLLESTMAKESRFGGMDRLRKTMAGLAYNALQRLPENDAFGWNKPVVDGFQVGAPLTSLPGGYTMGGAGRNDPGAFARAASVIPGLGSVLSKLGAAIPAASAATAAAPASTGVAASMAAKAGQAASQAKGAIGRAGGTVADYASGAGPIALGAATAGQSQDGFFRKVNPFNSGLGLWDTTTGTFMPLSQDERESLLQRYNTTVSEEEARNALKVAGSLLRRQPVAARP